MTRRPLSPINLKGKPPQPDNRLWWDKMDPTGDITLGLFAIALSPILFPYFWIKELFQKK